MNVNVEACKLSGKIIIACMEKKEDRIEVFRNKFRLKGENIFVEHDLSWEERNIQEEIAVWVKGEKEKRYTHKIGIG